MLAAQACGVKERGRRGTRSSARGGWISTRLRRGFLFAKFRDEAARRCSGGLLVTEKSNGKFSRRSMLGLVGGMVAAPRLAAQPPDRLRPQAGDELVFDEGPLQGEVVRPGLLELHARPVSALARDPASGVVRDGSRLNRVMLVRLVAERLTPRFRPNAAAGVVAYSAVCTHTGCDVFNWDAEQLRMACPCHESQFDIYDGARVVGGPAPRPLAMLPLEIVDDAVRVAGPFRGRVGFQQAF